MSRQVPVVTHREKILIVDDDQAMRELLLVLFRKNGYQTVAARDAGEGLTLAAEVDPTVAVIDYRIAGGGGINLIRQLAEHLPDVRCVFMTAHDNPDYFQQALEAGARDTIAKPFNLLDMVGKVERQIELKNKVPRGVIRLG